VNLPFSARTNTMASAQLPPVKWAQRKDALFVTIALPDVSEEKLALTSNTLTFTGKSSGTDWNLSLVFFKEVDAEADESKWVVGDRSIQFHIIKKNKDEDFWPRLLEDKKLEKTNVKVDWDKYVDSDEEEEGFDTAGMDSMGGGMGGMPPGMGGMGGMPGMGGGGGMDMASMMAGMGGGGGMPGMGGGPGGGMDMAAMQQMMAQMGGGAGGGMPPGMGGEEEEDSDDDDLPELEEDGAGDAAADDDLDSTD